MQIDQINLDNATMVKTAQLTAPNKQTTTKSTMLTPIPKNKLPTRPDLKSDKLPTTNQPSLKQLFHIQQKRSTTATPTRDLTDSPMPFSMSQHMAKCQLKGNTMIDFEIASIMNAGGSLTHSPSGSGHDHGTGSGHDYNKTLPPQPKQISMEKETPNKKPPFKEFPPPTLLDANNTNIPPTLIPTPGPSQNNTNNE